MDNSSFIYFVEDETADVSTPYVIFSGEPREVSWQVYLDLGLDMGPAGQHSYSDFSFWNNLTVSK